MHYRINAGLLLLPVLFCCLSFPSLSPAAGLCCQVSSGTQESLLENASQRPGNPTLQISYSFTDMDEFREGATRKSFGEVKEKSGYTSLPTRMGMTKYTLTAAYDFNRHITALVSVPWIRNTMGMKMLMKMKMGMMTKTVWMDHEMAPVDGLGDITVMGLYHYYPRGVDNPSDIISFGAGVKTPTGSSTEENSNGNFIHAHMQPGTGSWDPIVSLVYTKTLNRGLLQADMTYQFTTRNSHGYEFGDSFTANILGKFAALDFLNVTAGLTYLHVGRASDRDGDYTNLKSLMDDPDNTGGDSLWFSPGIQLVPLKNGSIDVKLQLPIWERVNGVQLVSDYRVLLGISFGF